VADPDQVLTLAEFQERAYEAIETIHRRQRLPILVGGTGQWIWAVVEGWGIPRVPPDSALRAELEARAWTAGQQAFHAELAEVDPEAAQKIDPRNLRRVIRALEVYYKTGRPITDHQRKNPPPYEILLVGLTRSRPQLYRRIDQRIERMLAEGLVAEVKQLVEAGYRWRQPAMSGLGYRQIGQYLQGEIGLEEAIALIKKETRRFVRQQYNWFSRPDARIHWFEIDDDLDALYPQIRQLVMTTLFDQQPN
jgi:tRNA dimethylallyltransferase